MYKDKRRAGEKQEYSREVERQLVKRLWPLLVALKQAGSAFSEYVSGVSDGDCEASASQQWFAVE